MYSFPHDATQPMQQVSSMEFGEASDCMAARSHPQVGFACPQQPELILCSWKNAWACCPKTLRKLGRLHMEVPVIFGTVSASVVDECAMLAICVQGERRHGVALFSQEKEGRGCWQHVRTVASWMRWHFEYLGFRRGVALRENKEIWACPNKSQLDFTGSRGQYLCGQSVHGALLHILDMDNSTGLYRGIVFLDDQCYLFTNTQIVHVSLSNGVREVVFTAPCRVNYPTLCRDCRDCISDVCAVPDVGLVACVHSHLRVLVTMERNRLLCMSSTRHGWMVAVFRGICFKKLSL
jgi:hypothetical protein